MSVGYEKIDVDDIEGKADYTLYKNIESSWVTFRDKILGGFDSKKDAEQLTVLKKVFIDGIFVGFTILSVNESHLQMKHMSTIQKFRDDLNK